MDIRPLTEDFAVSPQVDPAHLTEIAASGYRAVLCNRPDGEDPGQPDYASIAEAARAAGLDVRWVPMGSRFAEPQTVEDFARALEEMPKPLLAYCRSGTRCAVLWTIAQSGRMAEAELIERTAKAGYDLSGLVRQLNAG